jgi:hypothetical protein
MGTWRQEGQEARLLLKLSQASDCQSGTPMRAAGGQCPPYNAPVVIPGLIEIEIAIDLKTETAGDAHFAFKRHPVQARPTICCVRPGWNRNGWIILTFQADADRVRILKETCNFSCQALPDADAKHVLRLVPPKPFLIHRCSSARRWDRPGQVQDHGSRHTYPRNMNDDIGRFKTA